MNEILKKTELENGAVEGLLQEGIIELHGETGRSMRFGFMAALEHEGSLYVVLTKITSRKQLNHELLLIKLQKNDGKIDDYEVVHDPLEATTLIDEYIRLAVQALFEDVSLEGQTEDEEDDFDTEEEEESILH